MNGWLIRVHVPISPLDGSGVIETWATSIADRQESIDCVATATGGTEPLVIAELGDADLRGMNITVAGKAVPLRAEF
jgi:hypothetical protein